jgi:uncharacterized protein YbbK (DUF523 family)
MSYKLCSACLLGYPCAYDGKPRTNQKALALFEARQDIIIPICPEILAGLPTPRDPAEIYHATGEDVIDGRARVVTDNRREVHLEFLRGAYRVLETAKNIGATEFIGKANSPSCGVNQIYDGTFTKTLRNGDGVTSALLKRHGIKIINEKDL